MMGADTYYENVAVLEMKLEACVCSARDAMTAAECAQQGQDGIIMGSPPLATTTASLGGDSCFRAAPLPTLPTLPTLGRSCRPCRLLPGERISACLPSAIRCVGRCDGTWVSVCPPGYVQAS